jgi:hypothetical protein
MAKRRQLLCLAILLPCIGCHARPATVALQGEVSFDGRPIERGRLDFVPVDGTPGGTVSAGIVRGRYEFLPKTGLLPAGVYTVRIFGFRKTGRTEPNRVQRGSPPIEVEENFLPPACNVNSTLKVRVVDLPDKNKVDFQLGKTPAATPH